MVEVQTRLEAITTGNGYSQDIREVVRTRADIPDYPTVPAIYLYEGAERKDDTYASGKLRVDLDVVIVYLLEDYTDQATTANAALADVSKAMGTDYTVTGVSGAQTIVQFVERGNEVVVDPTDEKLIICGLEFDARYTHALGDPDNA
jgi:hypothetical protein